MRSMSFWGDILHRRYLLKLLTLREIRQQYVGSVLSVAWQVISPLIMILMYWVVFSLGFRVRPSGEVPFALWFATGLSVWTLFAGVVSSSVSSITGNAYLVKKTVFPVQLLPVVKAAVMLSNHGLFLLLLFALIWWQGPGFSVWFFQAIYYLFCALVLALSIGWLAAALNVFFRDVARLISHIIHLGMWATPVFWDLSMFPEPGRALHLLVSLNPMGYIVQGYRDSFLYAIPLHERLAETAIFWLTMLLLLPSCVYVFKRVRPRFADML